MQFDLERIRKNVREAETEELLDRITAYRAGMEPAAVEIIEAELDLRGVGEAQIREHAERRSGVLRRGNIARRCSFCDRPAMTRRWGWHRLWGKLPLFPRLFWYCDVHARRSGPAA
jgi:hypothetical protein